MTIRIGCAGASGTGKTKIVSYLSEKLHLPINPVGSRSVSQAMGFASPYDVDKIFGMRSVFQRRLFVEKCAWEEKTEAFISDRTTFDNLSYTAMHGGAETLSDEDLATYVTSMRRYTAILYFPLHRFQKIGHDPSRIEGHGYHVVYDLFLRALLREHQIQYLALDCAPEERIAFLDRFF